MKADVRALRSEWQVKKNAGQWGSLTSIKDKLKFFKEADLRSITH